MTMPYNGQLEFDEWCEMRAIELVNDSQFYATLTKSSYVELEHAVCLHVERVCGLDISSAIQRRVRFWDHERPGIAWAVMSHYADYIPQERFEKAHRGELFQGRFLPSDMRTNRVPYGKPVVHSEWAFKMANEIQKQVPSRDNLPACELVTEVRRAISCFVTDPTFEEAVAVADDLLTRDPVRFGRMKTEFANFVHNLMNEKKEPEKPMNQPKPEGIVIEIVTYINGTDVRELSVSQIADLIKQEEDALEKLSQIKTKPKMLKAEIAKRTAKLQQLVKVLDAMDDAAKTDE